MSIKPWREIARPHRDVLEGTFKQSEFAADISQVISGTAPPEYQDPKAFFSRTFITEGMRLLLISVAQRLSGRGGDPVVQLQTAFGGGKTHTLLAVMHMARKEVSFDAMEGIPPVLDQADIHDMPGARVAVLDGIRLSPSQPQQHGAVTARTLWGELAFQLLGDEGYALVEDSDQSATSPGKGVLQELLQRAAPCVILMDEVLAFMRQLEVGKDYVAGTFDANISFIQALTEAMKLVPDAMLLASLPESELEVGGAMGQRALNALEKYFARVESVWKPVASEEAFEIVRRRLFDHAGDPSEVSGVCRTFSTYYRDHSSKFPQETQSETYFERLCSSYPIHPEIFDRLYEDWSTLDKFQRTRGVLQYMAIIIHRLWEDDNRDALIMPGSIALYDGTVLNKSIHYLPQGWEPVIEREVDGPRSEPVALDGRETRFGAVHAARRVMRTIFLGSAPTVANQSAKGLLVERVLLGSAQPGHTVGVFEDVLKRLHDRLQYLYFDDNRFWLDTRPNLRREMESRKARIDTNEKLIPLIKTLTGKLFGKSGAFSGVHVFTPSADIPDDIGKGIRLVVLPPDPMCACSRGDNKNACAAAEKILTHRGEQPRQHRNRLVFTAPDYDSLPRLKEHGRTFIAWTEILDDINTGKLNLDMFQINQAKQQREGAERSLNQLLLETFRWILCPLEEMEKGRPRLVWESVTLSGHGGVSLSSAVEERIVEEEWLINQWSPIHLAALLSQWYFRDGSVEVTASKVWHDSCDYLYFPRLQSEHVFREALEKGMQSRDYFGTAAGRVEDEYAGFLFGKGGSAVLDDAFLIIAKSAAEAWQEKIDIKSRGSESDYKDTGKTGGNGTAGVSDGSGKNGDGTGSGGTIRPGGSGSGVGEVPPPPPPGNDTQKEFYGSVKLNPVSAKMDFATIVDEVVQQFTTQLGVDVSISVEIKASSEKGFDDRLQRAVKENSSVLKFNVADFES